MCQWLVIQLLAIGSNSLINIFKRNVISIAQVQGYPTTIQYFTWKDGVCRLSQIATFCRQFRYMRNALEHHALWCISEAAAIWSLIETISGTELTLARALLSRFWRKHRTI